MATHNKLGKKGEEAAKSFLIAKGYSILEKNWRYGRAEIDIIASNENFLIIVEVKTRSTDFFGFPEESISNSQKNRLIEAATAYQEEKSIDKPLRFDIISIINENNSQRIKHFEDAFFPFGEMG